MTSDISSDIKRYLIGHEQTFNSLIIIASNIATQKTLTFYTDGSLRPAALPSSPNNNTTTNMGFGWIIKSENNIPLTFHGNTILLPSFTKAECFAILTALLKKHLTINFSKIKAHSGDQYNDLADAEAKKGLDVPPITINPKFVPDATMIPMWDSLGPIDRDIRKFAKNITDAKTFDSSRTILL
ncbi:unnamed protein product [Rhizophagus irregularis]|nr:unnamed protein product [Rhizophagus irregularis]